MKKRKSGKDKRKKKTKPSGDAAAAHVVENASNLMFEDPFEDEFLEEEIVDAEGEASDAGMDDMEDAEPVKKVWLPGRDKLEEGQELDYDSRAYTCLHRMSTEWPCLSFDFLMDKLGSSRTRFPATLYMVAGTQAEAVDQNQVALMKVTDLHRMKHDNDSSDDNMSESDDDLDDDPILECRTVSHQGCVNRIRAMPQQPHIVGTWADTSNVHVWDLSKQLASLENPAGAAATPIASTQAPLFTFGGHAAEGFALDWGAVTTGRLITGDCSNRIYLWQPQSGGWAVDATPFAGHSSSVEDLQWSPTEDSVFMSCSADKTVRVWDIRNRKQSMISVEAHATDVNVISWNRKVAYLLASAADDGTFKVWDLRNFQADKPVASFAWHKDQATSIEWNPHDESVLAVTGADHQLTVWDLSLEEDTADGANAAAAKAAGIEDLPPQLLFVHQGQSDMKELHFHPQIPGLIGSTGRDFNLFKPANIENLAQPDEGT